MNFGTCNGIYDKLKFEATSFYFTENECNKNNTTILFHLHLIIQHPQSNFTHLLSSKLNMLRINISESFENIKNNVWVSAYDYLISVYFVRINCSFIENVTRTTILKIPIA